MSAFVPALSVRKTDYKVGLFLVAGLLPVSSIALHCAEIITLKNALLFLVLPAITVALATSAIDQKLLQLVFRGWISGIVAVAVYDLSRIPFVYAGWEDFIPHISAWLTDSKENSYLIGYTWRYAGNGGGLGIVFFLLANYCGWKKYIVSSGVTFGLLVFASLVALLIIFPNAQDLMFRITPVSFFGGLIGHIVYGYVLGKLFKASSRR